MLWEIFQLIAFKIPAHYGHGFMYYKCRFVLDLDPVPSTCRGLQIDNLLYHERGVGLLLVPAAQLAYAQNNHMGIVLI